MLPLLLVDLDPGSGVQLPEQHWSPLEQALPFALHPSADAAFPVKARNRTLPMPEIARNAIRREPVVASCRVRESKRALSTWRVPPGKYAAIAAPGRRMAPAPYSANAN